MITEIIYKSPNSEDEGMNIVAVKPFKLESEPRCYCCGTVLRTAEMKQKSTFRYYDTDGNVVGTVETYVCFDCMEKLTGRRPDNE